VAGGMVVATGTQKEHSTRCVGLRGSAMSSASARSGISCNHCHHAFALRDVGTESDAKVEALPDPFSLKCPLCGEDGVYSKASIGSIVSMGLHLVAKGAIEDP
jgi:hypothetical protein